MADLLSRSNQVQSTEWSLHPQVFKQICQRWFTHRSSKPSGAVSDQDLPQHDPDPPYYREVALSDIPSQRELYSMGNTGLLRREAKMTLLQPQVSEECRVPVSRPRDGITLDKLCHIENNYILAYWCYSSRSGS